MNAALIVSDKVIFDDGMIQEIVIWRVPEPVPPTTHGFKYSLFYGGHGGRLVGYDNERGKGDHRHFHDVERPYGFQGWEKLIEDFLADVAALRGEK